MLEDQNVIELEEYSGDGPESEGFCEGKSESLKIAKRITVSSSPMAKHI